MEYEETEGRKILHLRHTHVAEVRLRPTFGLRLSNGVVLDYTGTVTRTIGSIKAPGASPRSLTDMDAAEVDALRNTTPLSWVVFNSGGQRIVLSDQWHLAVRPGPGDSWRLDLADGRVLTYPPTSTAT
ncbi:MAG TPA: hypothetical protein VHJ17_23700 [Thermomonospora sp.]|nr:hypothetical protein [Thermomonospora sp.]